MTVWGGYEFGYKPLFDAPQDPTPIKWDYIPVTQNTIGINPVSAQTIIDNKDCDLVIVGDSTAAYSAAKTAISENLPNTCLVIPKTLDQFGGQITSTQVDFAHGKKEYVARAKIAENNNTNLVELLDSTASKQNKGWVSNISQNLTETRAFIKGQLTNAAAIGKIKILENAIPSSVDKNDSNIKSITFATSNGKINIKGSKYIDATATGELLPLSGLEYNLGYQNNSEAVNATTVPIAVKIVEKNSPEGQSYKPEIITPENLQKFQQELRKIKKGDRYKLFKYLFNYRSDKPITESSVLGSQAVLNMGFNDYMKPIIKSPSDTKTELENGWQGGVYKDRLKEATELSNSPFATTRKPQLTNN